MPAIKLQHVVSVSSEDRNFPAENLLKNDGFKKWKCVCGEKNAIVTLQFEKASEINQIDIGNEGSAFVEVLVGKSSSTDDNYQVILMSSSFMNPAESRASQNLNKVRIFGSDALSKPTLGQKWDRVKVVCTQPFNKNVQYGLSFIKFHSSVEDEASDSAKASPSKQLTLGAFVMKTNVPVDSIKAGSLFEKSKQKTEEPPLTGAAAIRAASKSVEKQTDGGKLAGKSRSTSRESPEAEVKTAENRKGEMAASNQISDQKELKTQAKRGAEGESSRSQSPPAKRSKADADAPSSNSTKDLPSSKQLMTKVVFVMSGFQNPLRGQLRDKAQELGAVYKADWGKGCTHLICAFENTPKYNEIRGKGRIVKKEWILDCYKQKKLLPWRQYRLGRAASPKSDCSDGEESSEVEKKHQPIAKHTAANPKTKESEEKKMDTKGKNKNGERKVFHQMSIDDDAKPLQNDENSKGKALLKKRQLPNAAPKNEDPFNASTDEDIPSTSAARKDEDLFNASTDEDVPSTSSAKNKKGSSHALSEDDDVPSTSARKNGNDPFDASTDEEGAENGTKSHDQLPELPNFFGGKAFFLYGSFPQNDRRTLVRYITAYNGLVIDYMDETINYVVTEQPWDENFDQALSDNGNLIFVKPSWILSCHESQKALPHQKFIVTAQ